MRHKEELEEDGIFVAKKDKLKEIKGLLQKVGNLDNSIKYAGSLTIFPRRAVLRVGMLLRDSEVAKTVRSYLLNIEETVDNETREWAIKREAGKMVREQFTSSIARSGENDRMHGHGFSNYTNLVYKTVFGKSANEIYEERLAPEGKLRDYLTEEELNAVRRVESVVEGFLYSGLEYSEIKKKLKEDLILDLSKFK